MRAPIRRALALLSLLFASLALAACGGGGGLSGTDVAAIGDEKITKTDYERWYQVIGRSQQQAVPGQKVVLPDAPAYKACVANLRKQAPTQAKGQPKVAASQLVKQCKDQDKVIREQTLNFLIQSTWVTGEAAEQGLKVSSKEVDKELATTKKTSFPKKGDFEKFLKQSGMTVEDVRFRLELDKLSSKLRDKIIADDKKVTDAEVAAYYKKNTKQFTQPEQRDIQVVLTRTEAKANQAKAALLGGGKFPAIVKQYSTDEQTKATDGELLGAIEGQQDKGLDQAAFAAPEGRIQGPVKGQFGFWVFRVNKITAKKTQKLADVKVAIRQQLLAQGQEKALNDFVKSYQKKWRSRTECRKGYLIDSCSNGPKPKPTPDPAGGTAPPPGS